jgi:hypothetical protein
MSRLPAILFGLAMLVLGIAVLLFPYEINSMVVRITRQRFDATRLQHTIRDMRIGGAGGIAIGLFILLACWWA